MASAAANAKYNHTSDDIWMVYRFIGLLAHFSALDEFCSAQSRSNPI